MAIGYNSTNISTIKYVSNEINTVTYNGAIVFEKLVDYTFPNTEVFMISDTKTHLPDDPEAENCMRTRYSYRYSPTYSAYKAFDNDLTTYYKCYQGTDGTTSKEASISIVFPFPIRIQSIKIINAQLATAYGLKIGTIYISPEAATSNFYKSGQGGTTTVYEYATVDRSDGANTSAYSTEHINDDYKSTDIRSICVYGDKWAHSYTKIIGEVQIMFKAKSADLAAAGLL